MLNNKSILITGGTGSFGKKFVETVLRDYSPRKLIVFSRDELKQFEMAQRFSIAKYPCLRYFLGDVRDKERLVRAFQDVDYVIHAAALKQVPAAEYNPEECIKTNVIGAMNVVDAALDTGVSRVVALSTDKASNPVNLYGATKLCSDKLFTAASAYRRENEEKIFSVVRYGNVLGSRGSVVPFFKERVVTGELPITDKRMTRFWITLDQAVQFVLKVAEVGRGGEIFVPKIPSTSIVDVASAIGPDCRQVEIGIRPGEKLHESMISPDEGSCTLEYDECYVIRRSHLDIASDEEHRRCAPGFSYTSDNNPQVLNVEEVKKLIDQISGDFKIEESRWSLTDLPA